MKYFKIALIIIIIVPVALAVYFYYQFEPTEDPGWGLNFSQMHAQYLGFDWKTVYLDMLNDLKPKKIRLAAYWENLEREPDLWYFQDVDEMIVEADKRGVEVILAVGHKLPRWPECHHPAWYNDLPDDQKKEKQLNMVRMAVEHFRQHSAIKYWQVENEALFGFGPDCPKADKDLFEKEIALVRSLDSRPIILTDSGELGRWVPTAKFRPDVFGSTMYRVVHNPQWGYFEYPLPPAFFRIKAGLTETLTGVKRYTGVELQAEPWFSDDVLRTDLNTQYSLMNPKILEDYAAYAQKSGLENHYLWGVEWWYWLAHKHNDWGMWDKARQIINQ
jgi:hypothetical protein